MIDIQKLLSFFKVEAKGIVDIGSQKNQRLEIYNQMQLKSIIFFEDIGTTTLDLWKDKRPLNAEQNIVYLDAQGFEFDVLLGAADFLNDVDCIMCKVHRAELFENCSQVTEIDLYLRSYGLRRVYTNWADENWGVACYVHEKFMSKIDANCAKIGLIDVNFAHSTAERGYDSACMLPTARFDWERNFKNIALDDQINIIVFTDQMIENVNVVNLPGKKKVAWLIEPREINPALIDRAKQLSHHFDAVVTHDKSLISSISNGYYASIASSWIKPQDWKVHDKSKLISIVASSKNFTSGHKLRHEAAQLIDENDRYGSAYKAVDNKIVALRDYKFSIVIENCRQDGFFTEKLVDALIVGTVPIYWGCADISEHFDTRGMICFNSLEDLKNILKSDLELFYNERRKYIESNAIIARKFASCDEELVNKLTGVN